MAAGVEIGPNEGEGDGEADIGREPIDRDGWAECKAVVVGRSKGDGRWALRLLEDADDVRVEEADGGAAEVSVGG